ncbi:MAG: LacI family DNA-binding transcriptional regulator [Candidatus Heritagella sp.]|nr:LacI family DNA-binding transcriptional regulator [Candidatus Heritagella sp.]
MKKNVRMADIAEKLGTSTVTVSNALAGRPGVGDHLRQKILATAREMEYTPRVHTTPGGKTGAGVIAVLVSGRFSLENTFYSQLYRSFSMACSQKGFSTTLTVLSREEEREARLPKAAGEAEADGLLMLGQMDARFLRAAAGGGKPCLLLDFYGEELDLPCVLSDNQTGGYRLTRHLLQNGCCQIGFVGSILATTSIMDRYLGCCKALLSAGISPRPEWLLPDRDENGNLIPLSLPEKLPQAFVCSCDEVAGTLIQALQQRGLRVPRDIRIAGYDDYRFARLCTPPLTSYRVDIDGMAGRAASLLIRRIRGKPVAAGQTVVPGALVIRDSTGE